MFVCDRQTRWMMMVIMLGMGLSMVMVVSVMRHIAGMRAAVVIALVLLLWLLPAEPRLQGHSINAALPLLMLVLLKLLMLLALLLVFAADCQGRHAALGEGRG